MAEQTPALYGVMAEFDGSDDARRGGASGRYAEGYRKFDAYSPFPIHELFDAMRRARSARAALRALGGIIGCLAGFGLQVLGVDRSRIRSTSAARPLHQLADVHPGDLRADDSVRVAHGGVRHVRA